MGEPNYRKKKREPSPIQASEYGKLPPQATNNLYLCIAVQL